MKIGIDYSLTSPAIVVIEGDTVTCNFFYKVKRNALPFELKDSSGRVFRFRPYEMFEFATREERFNRLALWSLQVIGKTVPAINIEGYSMGSTTGKFLEIAENGGVLRNKLWSAGTKINEFSPSSVKKFATGKGNAKKEQMHEAFKAETGIDLMVEMGCKGEKVPSPVSDIVDAYFIAKMS